MEAPAACSFDCLYMVRTMLLKLAAYGMIPLNFDGDRAAKAWGRFVFCYSLFEVSGFRLPIGDFLGLMFAAWACAITTWFVFLRPRPEPPAPAAPPAPPVPPVPA